MRDLLCSLMHLAVRENVDFDALLVAAHQDFLSEQNIVGSVKQHWADAAQQALNAYDKATGVEG